MTAKQDYVITRFVLLRLLAFVYLIAFLCLVTQLRPLIGHSGLLPADRFLSHVESSFDTPRAAAAATTTTCFVKEL